MPNLPLKLPRTLLAVTLILHSASFAAGKITWDHSHGILGSYGFNGQYSSLRDSLRGMGFTAEHSNSPLLENGLWDTDILVCNVLSNYRNPYTEAEIDRITQFVAGGGGLVIIADDPGSSPEMIAPLAERFGVLLAQNNGLSDLIRFDDETLFADVGSVRIARGGSLALMQDAPGRLVAWDAANHPGVVFSMEEGAGGVVVIGDADMWLTRNIEINQNYLFARNVFTALDRVRSGRVGSSMQDTTFYMLPRRSWQFTITVQNSGEGLLETGVEIGESGGGWLSVEETYALLETDASVDFHFAINSNDLPEDTLVSAEVFILHNDPESEPIAIEVSLDVLPRTGRHFEVVDPNGVDHSLVVRELLLNDQIPAPGVEVGVFTTGGICAGSGVYSGGRFGIIARGDDPITEELDGFETDEEFHFRLYLPWSDAELDAVPEFISGPEAFRENGITSLNLYGGNLAEVYLDMSQNWNMVSLNVIPPSLDARDIFRSLAAQELLVILKASNGDFWYVPRTYSNLGDWDVRAGYLLKVADSTGLTVSGRPVPFDTPIPLPLGWSMISYLPREAQAIESALETVWDNLGLIKSETGAFTHPGWDWVGLDELKPGDGYMIRMLEADTLIYPEGGEERARSVKRGSDGGGLPGGADMSLLLTDVPAGRLVKVVDESERVLAGAIADASGRVGISVPGDDPESSVREGFQQGERFEVMLKSPDGQAAVQVEWLEGEGIYRTNGFAVGRVAESYGQPEQLDFTVSPNPFNDVFKVTVNKEAAIPIQIKLYDIQGRQLRTATLLRGSRSIAIEADALASGVLILQIESRGQIMRSKVVHLP